MTRIECISLSPQRFDGIHESGLEGGKTPGHQAHNDHQYFCKQHI